MHRRSPWPEAGQLCESGPFRAFCHTELPTPDQRIICQACGHDHPEVSMPPEAVWEAGGHPSWTAPYVWETNYLED